MDEFRTRAVDLHFAVQRGEAEQLERGLTDYSAEEERQAIIHMRQDVVMLVSLMMDLNRQLKVVRLAVIALLIVVAVLLARSW